MGRRGANRHTSNFGRSGRPKPPLLPLATDFEKWQGTTRTDEEAAALLSKELGRDVPRVYICQMRNLREGQRSVPPWFVRAIAKKLERPVPGGYEERERSTPDKRTQIRKSRPLSAMSTLRDLQSVLTHTTDPAAAEKLLEEISDIIRAGDLERTLADRIEQRENELAALEEQIKNAREKAKEERRLLRELRRKLGEDGSAMASLARTMRQLAEYKLLLEHSQAKESNLAARLAHSPGVAMTSDEMLACFEWCLRHRLTIVLRRQRDSTPARSAHILHLQRRVANLVRSIKYVDQNF